MPSRLLYYLFLIISKKHLWDNYRPQLFFFTLLTIQDTWSFGSVKVHKSSVKHWKLISMLYSWVTLYYNINKWTSVRCKQYRWLVKGIQQTKLFYLFGIELLLWQLPVSIYVHLITLIRVLTYVVMTYKREIDG